VPENWVDVVILFLLAVYGLRGVQRGLLLGLVDLAGFVLALAAALRFYPIITEAIAPHVPAPPALVKPLAFIAVWLAADVAFSLVVRLIGGAAGAIGSRSPVNAVLGFLPGVLKGAVVAGLVLALALALPLPEPVKSEITGSALGGGLSGELRAIERTLQDVFGDAVLDGINFATVRPQTDQRVPLRFTLSDARIDEEAESRLLKLLNEERVQAGLKTLSVDPTLVQAARSHSRDMLAQGYFAHVNNEGKTPADRARAAGVRFMATGENLALAPTVELAHRGLMESPGHRANILAPQWSRVGIGVADAGIHGKAFAQEFAD
jgi:uncharacterized protein YkwD/uncharacterized membrane protein required for colicin V production